MKVEKEIGGKRVLAIRAGIIAVLVIAAFGAYFGIAKPYFDGRKAEETQYNNGVGVVQQLSYNESETTTEEVTTAEPTESTTTEVTSEVTSENTEPAVETSAEVHSGAITLPPKAVTEPPAKPKPAVTEPAATTAPKVEIAQPAQTLAPQIPDTNASEPKKPSGTAKKGEYKWIDGQRYEYVQAQGRFT